MSVEVYKYCPKLCALFSFTALFIFACGAHDFEQEETGQESFTFNNINDYKTVTIGEQTWMAENLNYYVEGSKCYKNKAANCKKYGRLYDWNTAVKSCPSGWHLPTDDDWDALIMFVGHDSASTFLRATSGWNKDGNGADKFGFAALPGGLYKLNGNSSDDGFHNAGEYGYWWSATEAGFGNNYNYRLMRRGVVYVYKHYGSSWPTNTTNLSVRCVRD